MLKYNVGDLVLIDCIPGLVKIDVPIIAEVVVAQRYMSGDYDYQVQTFETIVGDAYSGRKRIVGSPVTIEPGVWAFRKEDIIGLEKKTDEQEVTFPVVKSKYTF